MANDWQRNELGGLSGNELAGERCPVNDGVSIQSQRSLASGYGAEENAFSAQRGSRPGADNIEKHLIPLQGAGKDDFCTAGQRKMVCDVDEEGRGRVAQKRQGGMAGQSKVLKLQVDG